MILPTIDEPDDRFHAAPSTIPGAGQGLFARVPLRAGDRLIVVGVRVRRDSAADRYTAFADAYKLRAGDDLVIPCGAAAVANDSSQPNLRKVVEGEMVATGKVVHQTKRLFLAESVVHVAETVVARGNGTFMRSATRLDEQVGYVK